MRARFRRFKTKHTEASYLRDLFRQGILSGGYYDYQSRPPGDIFFQDFSGTPATALGDPVRVILDSNSGTNTGDKYLLLSGASGTYASTPDAAALDITGDIDIRVHVALQDWTPAANSMVLVAKRTTADGLAYQLTVSQTTGTLNLSIRTGGVDYFNAAISSVAPTVTDGAELWVRFTRASATGSTFFYTSDDGVTWTQLGTERTTVAGSLDTNSAVLQVGASRLGLGSDTVVGRIYRAQVYNGINGTLAADFNPGAFVSGTTLTSGGAVYTLNGAACITNVTGYRDAAAFLNGTSGTYFSTPDAAGLDITGDIDIRCHVALQDWTPADNDTLVNKYITTTNQRSYSFAVTASTGVLNLLVSANGSAGIQFASTAATSAVDGQALWIRVTLDLDNGASNSEAKFYTSADGVTWTQLGTTVLGAVIASLFVSTAELRVGADGTGAALTTGRIYRAQVYAGLDGTDLRADFNPAQYSSGNTFISGGAVYTRNGQAYIAGDGTHRVTPSDATRLQLGRFPSGVGVLGQLLNNSDDLQGTGWGLSAGGVGTVPTLTPGFTDPDGGATAYRLQADRVGALVGDLSQLSQSLSGFANPHNATVSIWAKSNTGATQNVYFRNQTGAGGSAIDVTTSWQRFSFSGSAAATVDSIQIGTRGTVNTTAAVDILIWHPMFQESLTLADYQSRGAGAYDITQSGVPSTTALYRSTTLYSESLLPAITAGSIVLAGDKGIWSDTLTYAGGTFAWGPTTYTGGPAGLYANIVGLFDVGGVFTTTALSAAQLTQVQRYFVRAGSVGSWERTEIITNGGPDFTVTTGWSGPATIAVDSGDLRFTVGSVVNIQSTFGAAVAGERYRVRTTARRGTTAGEIRTRIGTTVATQTTSPTNISYDTIVTAATATGFEVLFMTPVASETAFIDRASAELLTLNPTP